MDRFLHALQGGQLPAGIRSVLDLRFGEETVAGLIGVGLLTRGAPATRYPCPRGGSSCPREIVENPGDDAFPFVAIPPSAEVCCPSVRLAAEDLVTWQTSRRALVTKLSELYAVRGPANLRDEVFPCAHRLGRAAWRGLDREVLFCTDLNGAAPLAFLLARQASQQPMVVLAHARTRYTPPDVDTHFAAGPVSVVFLEDELRLDGDRLVRVQPMGVAEPAGVYRASASGQPPQVTEASFQFRPHGEAWALRYQGGRTLLMNETKGLRYMRFLLMRPGDQITARELVDLDEGRPPGHHPFATSLAADQEAIDAVRTAMRELRSELVEAESLSRLDEAERLRGEIEKLEAYVLREAGLGGRRRSESPEQKRLRNAVSNAIRRSIGAIKKQDEGFGDYLKRQIQTGFFLEYRDIKTRWLT